MECAKRIAIVGAGPVGLEAALFARLSGYEVAVFEQGSIANNLQSWGHVRLFSPFGLNVSPWGREALEASGRTPPSDDELLTGRDFAESYLLPLSELPELAGCVHEQTQVISIGRAGQLKQDNAGKTSRGQTPFQILVSHRTRESIKVADYLLDCSGTYPKHNWLGADGMPCPGERESLAKRNYQLPDILGRDQHRFANRTTLVVGGGYSAATSIVAIAELANSCPKTEVVWLTRRADGTPIEALEEDELPERKWLTYLANQLAGSELGPIDWRPGGEVRSISKTADRRLEVVICQPPAEPESLIVDEILGHVGYRPDRSIYEELQVHECFASGGPMKLALSLLGEDSTDCLSQTSHGAESLENPEPGFFILGSKSYGRNSRFLLKVGIQQIRDVFSLISRQS